MKRSFGQPPWQAKRTSHSRQYGGSVSRLSSPNCRCCGETTSSRMWRSLMFPSRWRARRSGRTSRCRRCAPAPARPARLRVDAQARRLADPVRERDVEHLHEDLADVPANPLLEDVDQEASVPLCRDRAPGHAVARPGRRAGGRARTSTARRRPRGFGDALDDRDELHEPRAALVAQEAVDLAAAAAVRSVDRRQDVAVDSAARRWPRPRIT